MKSISVPASMDWMQYVLAQIGLLLEQEGCPENERRLIEISTEEIFTNIASYAYGSEKGKIQVEYGVCPLDEDWKKTVICFGDQGRPFDPFARDDPDLELPIEERPIGGLGIYMVKQFMDRATYQYVEGWNKTTIEKRFPRADE